MLSARPGCPVTLDGLDALLKDYGRTMTAGEVAEALGMTKQGVYHWLRDGLIPGYKLGTTWFIMRDELKETLLAGANTAARQLRDTPEDDSST